MTIEHINPEGLHGNPALSQGVEIEAVASLP